VTDAKGVSSWLPDDRGLLFMGFRAPKSYQRYRPQTMESELYMQRWPQRLWLVRHGESAGNVASQLAVQWGEQKVDVAERDVDVPLSPAGIMQSRALGKWFSELAPDTRPNVLLTSPYVRAQQTASFIRDAGGLAERARPTVQDERLREREFGILDR